MAKSTTSAKTKVPLKPALTAVIIDALEDIKAKEIKLINVANITSVSDYIAIASADSTRQTRALASNVMDKVREAGYSIYGTEGEQTGEWVLVDCGDVVVHIMQPAVREYYKLEELWLDGKVEFPKPKADPRVDDTGILKSAAKSRGTKKTTAGATDAKPKTRKTAVKKKPVVAKKVVVKKTPAVAKKKVAAKIAKVAKVVKVVKAVQVVKIAKAESVVKVAKKITKPAIAKKPVAKKAAVKKIAS